jgi:hypothetical protein
MRRRAHTEDNEEVKPIHYPELLDRQLLQLADPFLNFKALTIPWFVEFTNSEYTWVRKRLRRLTNPPNYFMYRPKDQYHTINADHKTLFYGLAERGFTHLVEKGLAYPHSERKDGRQLPNVRHRANSFWHEVGVDMGYYAPLIYRAMHSQGTFNVIDFAELYSGHFPDKLRTSSDPLLITLFAATEGTPAVTMRLDGTPHVIETDNRHSCIPGIQFDTGTKSIRKLEIQIDQAMIFIEKELYRAWGLDNVLIPFLFTTKTRREHARRYTAQKYRRSLSLLFGEAPDFSELLHYPLPSDAPIRQPFQRAGYPDFYLSTLSEKPL